MCDYHGQCVFPSWVCAHCETKSKIHYIAHISRGLNTHPALVALQTLEKFALP